MNFSEINHMDNLKNILTEEENFSNYLYFVYFYNEIMDSHRYQKPIKILRFGNEDAGILQRVTINIYKDQVDLHCASEGFNPHKRNVDIYKDYTDEQLIIFALDEWNNDYKN